MGRGHENQLSARSCTVLDRCWLSSVRETGARKMPRQRKVRRIWQVDWVVESLIISEERGQELLISFCLSPAKAQQELHTASSCPKDCAALC